MRQSRLFTRTRREAPRDEEAQSAQLLLRAGFIHKEHSGVYSFLPLGKRVLENIMHIIREEMNELGGQEVSMSSLQEAATWEPTNRWSDEEVDVWFKTKLKNDTELGLAFTHEEPMTRMMREHLASYKDLPKLVYQFQTKFRNETRAKSGILRTREFIMKDAYSFTLNEADHQELYEKIAAAYTRIFERVGLGDDTRKAFASGGLFSKYSHEYQTLLPIGEDTVHVDAAKGIAINDEVCTDEVCAELGTTRAALTEMRGVEVGNIFTLGTRFSAALGLTVKDEAGESVPVFMGSYGIGPARVMGVIAERYADEKGLVWPYAVAPFHAHLVGLNLEDAAIREYADGVYEALKDRGIEVLYDDRPLRAGEKFADSDMLGIPYRIVVSARTHETGLFEVVTRTTGEVRELTEEALYDDFAVEQDA